MPFRDPDQPIELEQLQVTMPSESKESDSKSLHDAFRAVTGEDAPVVIPETTEEQLANLRLDERVIVAELEKYKKELEDGLNLAKDKCKIEGELTELRLQRSTKQQEEERLKQDKQNIEDQIVSVQKNIPNFNLNAERHKKTELINFGIETLRGNAQKIVNAFMNRLDARLKETIFYRIWSWATDGLIQQLEGMRAGKIKVVDKVTKKERKATVGDQWRLIVSHIETDKRKNKKSLEVAAFHERDRAPMAAIGNEISIKSKIIKSRDLSLLLVNTQRKIQEIEAQIRDQEGQLALIGRAASAELKKSIDDNQRKLERVQTDIGYLQAEINVKQLAAFKVIYKALFEGQSKWFKSAPLLEKWEELTVEKIKDHVANKNINARSRFAWELAQQEIHYKKYDLSNTALVTAIYKWAKEHTPIARSRDTFSFLFATQTKGSLLAKFLPCFFKPQKDTNDLNDKRQEIFTENQIEDGRKLKNTRLAKIADVFDPPSPDPLLNQWR